MSWLIREFKICVSLISGIKTQFLFFSGRLFVNYLTKIWGNACTNVHKIDTNVTINIKNSTNITIIWGNICKNVHKINTNFTINFKSSKISTLSWTLKFLKFKRLHINFFVKCWEQFLSIRIILWSSDWSSTLLILQYFSHCWLNF